MASSASSVRRAEAAAARRDKLLRRLAVLHARAGSAGAARAAARGPASAACGPHAGAHASPSSTAAEHGVHVHAHAAHDQPGRADLEEGWERFSCLGDGGGGSSSGSATAIEGQIGRLSAAVRHIEAGEVLADHPGMKGVHSTASVRSLLSRLSLQAGGAWDC
jgi:hypothetical protein